jgi:hypothetical protein
MSGYTALLVLADSQNALVWGASTRVPLEENSLILFQGNTTHGIPMESSHDEVRFLGPFFRLQDFVSVGDKSPTEPTPAPTPYLPTPRPALTPPTLCCEIDCNTKTVVTGDNCVLDIEFLCEGTVSKVRNESERGYDSHLLLKCHLCAYSGKDSSALRVLPAPSL